jgi:hypothetical protein
MLSSVSKIRFPRFTYQSERQQLSGLDVSYEIDEKFVTVSIKEEDETIWEGKSMAATLIEIPGNIVILKIEKESPYKIVHEIVSYVLTKSKTDRKLKDLVEPPYDPARLHYLNMTPDYFETIDGELMIGELGTKSSNQDSAISESYSMKMSDLSEKVRGSGLKNELFCIIVSPSCVYSNLSFTEEQTNLLCGMFKLGTSCFFSMCSRFGLTNFNESTPLSSFKREFDEIISEMKLEDSENPLIISDTLIDYWYSQIKEVDINMISRKLLDESLKDSKMYTIKEYDNEDLKRDFMEFKLGMEKEGTKLKSKHAFKVPFPVDNFLGLGEIKIVDNPTNNVYISLLNTCVNQFEERSGEEVKALFENDPDVWDQTSNREFGFVSKEFSNDEKLEFSKLGPFAKSIKPLGYVELRKESKKQISLDSDDSRINSFIRWYDILINKGHMEMRTCFEDFYVLRESVLNQYEEPRVSRDISEFEDAFSGSWLGQQCQLMTLIAQELNYKIAKVSSKQGVYFNRISKTNWFMICKPTGSHMFYCLVRYNNGKMGEFNDLFDEPIVNTEDVTIFPWRSTDRDRITTWLNIFENMLVVYSDILSHYGYEKTEVAQSKLLFTFLINCDNKQTTSDCIYLWREMSVKLTSGDRFSKPGILFSKLPKIRSLLASFVVKQMFLASDAMISERPQRVPIELSEEGERDVSLNRDTFINLLDLVTLLPEQKFENVIYTSYLACYHSYATMSQMAANFKVVEKIADYELKLRDARAERMGRLSEWGDVRDHEFNLHLSLLGGLLRRKLFKDIYQESYEDFMYSSLRKSMTKGFLEFATFKASVERYQSYYFKPLERVSTKKAIQTLKQQFDVFDKCILNPYEDLGQLLQFIDEEIHAKVDKKMDQAKGLREILTMDMRSRFFLNILERFMDLLNKESPSEVLSKGSQKERISRNMDDAIYELSEDGYELIVIDQIIDHSKWCQMFIMNKFATHLCPILPKQIFRFFCKILNKITKKRIFLGKEFMSKMMSNDEIYSESISELRSQFKQKGENTDLLDEMEVALKNMSNMGQGWLQNLSGSDGDSDMQVVSSVIEIWLQRLKNTGRIPEDTRIYNFRISSSDDQRQRKIIKIKSGDGGKVKNFMRLCGMLPMVVSKHSCKKMSVEKSEIFSMNLIGEFNQVFSSSNTTFVGTCKFTRASLEIPVTVSINDRFENFANTRRNLVENGIDIFTSSLAQLMQMRVHYRSFGLAVDPMFPSYRKLIMDSQSPYFGFFPWESSHLLGMFGNEKARYDNVMKNLKSRFVLSKMLSSLDLRMGARGELGPSINFRVTKKKKFLDFRKSFDMDLQYFKDRPHILYVGAEERMDTRKMIDAKAHMSDAELSFVYDSTSKVFAGSFMVLREPVIKFSVLENGKRIKKRMNMFGLIEHMTSGYVETSVESILPVFPSSVLYETVSVMIPDLSSSMCFPIRDLSRRKSTFHFSNVVGQMDIPLIDCVSQVWFGKSSGHNSKLTMESFRTYKDAFPWVRDTHNETMSNGLFDFENPFQLKNTLESMKQQEKKFSIFSPIRQAQLDKMIRSYQKYNYKRCHVLTDVKSQPYMISKDTDMYRVARIINGPFTEDEKLYSISQLSLENYKPQYDNNLSRRKIYLLWLLSSYKNGEEVSIKDIVSSMLISGKEYVPYYKLPQKKTKDGKYEGNMILDMIFENNTVQIELISGKLKVVSNGMIFLNSKAKEICDLISKLGFNDKMVRVGHRLTPQGIVDKSKNFGFEIEVRRTFPGFDDKHSKLSFDFSIEESGRVKVKLNTSKDKNEFDYSFFISDWIVSGFSPEDVKGFDEKWISNVPLNKTEMRQLLSIFPTWSKLAFKTLMDGKVLPTLMMQERSQVEVSQVVLDEEILDLMKMSKIYDMSVLDEFVKEFEFDNQDEILNNVMDESAMMGIDISEIDVTQFEYFQEIKMGRIGNNIFDNMIKELAYMNVYDLYKVNYKLPITSDDLWFEMFKELCDYDKRPLLEKYKSSDSDKGSNESIKLGKDKIIVKYRGLINKKELEPAIELFSDSIYFENDDDLPVQGIFVDINGRKEHLKIKSFKRFDILNTFVSYILDKVGITDEEPKLKINKQAQTFEFSKEEIKLSQKVSRYWSRFNRYKDDVVYAADLGEFFIESPNFEQ